MVNSNYYLNKTGGTKESGSSFNGERNACRPWVDGWVSGDGALGRRGQVIYYCGSTLKGSWVRDTCEGKDYAGNCHVQLTQPGVLWWGSHIVDLVETWSLQSRGAIRDVFDGCEAAFAKILKENKGISRCLRILKWRAQLGHCYADKNWH